jgi:hypothetical protein
VRESVDRDRVVRLMQRLVLAAPATEVRIYFAGGASALLMGWRASTIDVDVAIVPEADDVFRAIPGIKEALDINIELASPGDFIPLPPGWEERSLLIERRGSIGFYHFDFYSQALAKVERGHAQDEADVRAMIGAGLVEPQRAREMFDAIEPGLYRFPAIDPGTFRRAVERAFWRGL